MIITHPEKIMFPAEGITKGELAAYYEAIASVMLPHLRGRPITMERFHRGIDAPGFFQKDVSKGFPEWLERVEVPKHGGTTAVARKPEQHHDSRLALACAEALPARHLRLRSRSDER